MTICTRACRPSRGAGGKLSYLCQSPNWIELKPTLPLNCLLPVSWLSGPTQNQLDNSTIGQCYLAALRTWDKVEEPRKRSTSFTKVIQGPGDTFTEFYKD